ncbi:putative HMG box transcriptional regulator [Aspergillus mulundensis]|uniref:HMG box domain-containing protein n=1 Tax=Aspergillus mulundensis TaxID=1810919 RepID=A0A3D8S4B0_9EURO|nr:hypothetical protein DSM5745_04665 [Aspergillus mulundensis]RDW81108.1 hypothetical protein DSM5745_04665 [Aspergillus mulundensis]
MADHRPPSYRYSESLPKVDLLSLHRSRVSVDKGSPGPSAALEAPKPGSALPTRTIPMRERPSIAADRSASSSPVKSTAQGPRDSVTQFCLCQPDPKIPRPRNAFILYRQHYQGAVVAQNPGLANPDISKIIGEQWRKLPQATKDEWKALAEEEKARHQQQYPEYRYQPRRYGRDGTARSLSSGLGHNPPGSTICNRCGGRIMNPPASPDAGFSGGSVSSGRSSYAEQGSGRNYSVDQGPRGMKHGSQGHPEHRLSRARQWEESGSMSPDSKRRRTNPNPHVPFRAEFHRDKSPPNSPYSVQPGAGRTESMSGPRSLGHGHAMQAPRGLRPVKEHPQPDPSLTLPPLKTQPSLSAGMTPITPFAQDGFHKDKGSAVMSIPFLNKIKLLAKISPQLPLSFRDGDSRRRGPVIAVDGQDTALVKNVTEYLSNALSKEGKFQVRVFDGPEISEPKQKREGSTEPGEMCDKQVEYWGCISKWHQVSEKVKSFVKSEPPRRSIDPGSGEEGSPRISPKTANPDKATAEANISSPPASSDNGSEAASSPPETASTPNPTSNSLRVAIVPRYQLTTADAYACMAPISDHYNVADHWQWMASLWRGAVGPDITVYVRECDVQELRQVGNPVEIRLQDAKTVVVRRASNAPGPKELEEKVLKRLGFEIEDYLTQ